MCDSYVPYITQALILSDVFYLLFDFQYRLLKMNLGGEKHSVSAWAAVFDCLGVRNCCKMCKKKKKK